MEKEEQLKYLNEQMKRISQYLENLVPEETGLEEIDQMIQLLDQLEKKCRDFRTSWANEGEQ